MARVFKLGDENSDGRLPEGEFLALMAHLCGVVLPEHPTVPAQADAEKSNVMAQLMAKHGHRKNDCHPVKAIVMAELTAKHGHKRDEPEPALKEPGHEAAIVPTRAGGHRTATHTRNPNLLSFMVGK